MLFFRIGFANFGEGSQFMMIYLSLLKNYSENNLIMQKNLRSVVFATMCCKL